MFPSIHAGRIQDPAPCFYPSTASVFFLVEWGPPKKAEKNIVKTDQKNLCGPGRKMQMRKYQTDMNFCYLIVGERCRCRWRICHHNNYGPVDENWPFHLPLLLLYFLLLPLLSFIRMIPWSIDLSPQFSFSLMVQSRICFPFPYYLVESQILSDYIHIHIHKHIPDYTTTISIIPFQSKLHA